MHNKLISIVVPMYYEEKVADECYKRLKKVMNDNEINYEFIFVNDGSKDKTFEILNKIAEEDNNTKIISFSRNFGHQIAVTAGVDKAKGDAVVVIDADLQDPPELIPKMIDLWNEGYKVVYAKRKKRKGESFFKLFTAGMFYRILDKMTDIDIPLDTGDFRLMDRDVVNVLKTMKENNRFVRGMVSWVGFKQTPIEYERDERFAGETKYPLKKMIKFASDGIISFSAKPLKLMGSLGVFCVSISLIIFLYALIRKLTNDVNVVSGWASIMTAVTFLGGVQLLSISVLGEYIGRIYDESKGRPLYVIEKEVNIE
ncbi:glycosyltransferase family 2 protein [Clostridium intestinale]|uniref:Dolichol-phosphate mannosyltransferase n=1 Tax=Clostridium intestinale DSM 6191 TaxID=1121320 RepID=A0A1M5XF38_9CLOT|nr:glycosyltransferase family 2 protein [Clostridium intestinale]SHH98411.1 dolichol-phosphate mannosyltransferase [Clostridium intestinale DSM 6191]